MIGLCSVVLCLILSDPITGAVQERHLLGPQGRILFQPPPTLPTFSVDDNGIPIGPQSLMLAEPPSPMPSFLLLKPAHPPSPAPVGPPGVSTQDRGPSPPGTQPRFGGEDDDDTTTPQPRRRHHHRRRGHGERGSHHLSRGRQGLRIRGPPGHARAGSTEHAQAAPPGHQQSGPPGHTLKGPAGYYRSAGAPGVAAGPPREGASARNPAPASLTELEYLQRLALQPGMTLDDLKPRSRPGTNTQPPTKTTGVAPRTRPPRPTRATARATTRATARATTRATTRAPPRTTTRQTRVESSNCRNTYPDSKCESWARTDQCRVNPSFMLEHCKKSCKVCTGGGGGGSNNGGDTDQGKPDSGDCAENKHPNDQECEYWARRGECEANPSWMLQNCRKACKPEDCGSDKACVNDYGDDAQCSRWANRGECDNNPNWMLENCHKACNPKCVQKDTDACSKDGCRKGTCKNTYRSDKDCKWWAMDNQCETNPGWMLVNCAKACKCEEEEDNETPQPGGKCSDPDGFCLQLGRRGQCSCGYSYLQNNNLQEQPSTNNSRPQPIIWGREARPNTWPWQASLQLKEGYSGYGEEIRWKHQCGGTLITPKWILTAAHCVYQPGFDNPVNWRAVLGEHRISQDSGKEEIRRVIRIIKHPQFYYYGGARNDIALLELDSDVPLGTYIQTACLASKNQCFHRNPNCFITGWGATLGTGDPDVLNEVRMEVRTKAECVREWSANRIFDTHICIGHGYQSACHGDSGGPLVCKVGSRYTLAGVTSWGPQGCQGQPSVYTRVSSYIDWITDVIRQLTY